jgi:YtcA family
LQSAVRVTNPIVVFGLAAHVSVGAPSFELFGAFFPAWMLCSFLGIAGAIVARVLFVKTGLSQTFPYQLAVCTALGSVTALLVWLGYFA